jgi:cysteine synthase A
MSAEYDGSILDNILGAIGNTPLVRLNRITKGVDANILVKCEHLNPSGSIKDRMGLRMIEDAEAEGTIKPGRTIIGDASSSNTAQALSMIGAVKGYKVKLFFPELLATKEKVYALSRYGAEYGIAPIEDEESIQLINKTGLCGATLDILGRLECLKEEKRNEKFLWMRQFSNPSNIDGVSQIGNELLAQTNGKINTFVSSIGTGGTFLGISRVLKRELPNVKCVGVQPSAWEGWINVIDCVVNDMPGIFGGIVKEIQDSGIADEIIFVSNYEAKAMAYRLSAEEGLYCGISSGANVYAALQVAKKPGMREKNIVTLLVDRGERNLSDESYMT